MADSSRILSGSYKGVAITIDGGGLSGGRKVAVKQFPGRDTQSVEDLGKKPRAYSLDIIISDKQGQDYFAYRDALIAVLEEGGPGELIHPLYGRIENIVAVSYSLNERFAEFGAATVSVQFELDSSTGIPVRSENVATQLAASNDAVRSAAKQNIENNFKVSTAYPDNFSSAAEDVGSAIDAAMKASSYRGEIVQGYSEYMAEINKFSADINRAISSPQSLAGSYDSMLAGINNLYQSARVKFDAYRSLFGFGGDRGKTDTAARAERQRNADALAAMVNASALGFAYLAAPSVDYATTDEIDSFAAQLDGQYRLVMTSEADQATKDAMAEMRIKTLQALDEVRINTSRVITVETTPTTARLLAFSYYGSDDLGETIAGLNGIDDVSFVSGSVKVLTE